MLAELSASYLNCSDEILLQSVMRKEIGAFETLYDRHAPLIYNILLRIVCDASVAEELLQDTFWQVWQKADQYSGTGGGIAWLHRIARNKAIDQLRRQRGRLSILMVDPEVSDWSPTLQQQSAESEFEQDWLRQQVQQALAQIPHEQRLCLEMTYFEGLSHQEIADQMQAPLGTIKTRIRIGMQKVERWLLGSGYTHGAWANMAS